MDILTRIKRQGMIGLAVWQPGQSWDGHLFRSLLSAERAARKAGGEAVLVRTDGRLYHQADGQALGPVEVLGSPTRLDLRRRVGARSHR
jgi:hypothetical protein